MMMQMKNGGKTWRHVVLYEGEIIYFTGNH